MGFATKLDDQKRIMAPQYKGVPEGASAVVPRLTCRDVEAQVEFCLEALGGVEALRRPGPDGRAAHCDAEIRSCHEDALSGISW
jgi:hypothetical protein